MIIKGNPLNEFVLCEMMRRTTTRSRVIISMIILFCRVVLWTVQAVRPSARPPGSHSFGIGGSDATENDKFNPHGAFCRSPAPPRLPRLNRWLTNSETHWFIQLRCSHQRREWQFKEFKLGGASQWDKQCCGYCALQYLLRLSQCVSRQED